MTETMLFNLLRGRAILNLPPLPQLDRIRMQVQRVHERWPDEDHLESQSDQNLELAKRLRFHVTKRDWHDVNLSFVLAAAAAVFDVELRTRRKFSKIRKFLYKQAETHQQEEFLSGMLWVYLESFESKAKHSRKLAEALEKSRGRMAPPEKRLLFSDLKGFLSYTDGPKKIADQLVKWIDDQKNPYDELCRCGLRDPHGAGFMKEVHEHLSNRVQKRLNTMDMIDKYFDWVRPSGMAPMRVGAKKAIESLVQVWLDTNIMNDSEILNYMIAKLTDDTMYGHPHSLDGYSAVWSSVDHEHRDFIVQRLIKENMDFFTKVISRAHDGRASKDMWEKRLEVWKSDFYDKGYIKDSCVAFSPTATKIANVDLKDRGFEELERWIGVQRKVANTSLLIMKINSKIVVEGCHNYKTRIFNQDNHHTPKFRLKAYDAERIRHQASEAESHHPIENWKRWVKRTLIQ